MKTFFVKCLIIFIAMQKKNFFTLMVLVIATIILFLRGNTKEAMISLFSCVFFSLLITVFSIACISHRKKCPRFKVYFSFSEGRTPEMARYISDYLKPAFWIFNIDYYDFREHKRFHYMNEPAICEEIDKNLAVSDIFLRFIGQDLQPNKIRFIKDQFANIRFNPFTGALASFDTNIYYDYEVNVSYDKFGFTNRYNRFQLISDGVIVSPMEHIQTIFVDSMESALDFALRLINELSHGFHEQLYWKQSKLFRRMEV